jgi:NAD(P)-dependent dehydrogenase (short-subunit alcohol dehydrogenase family)
MNNGEVVLITGASTGFGRLIVPTIALFKAGAEIARQSGALPKSAVLAWLGNHGIMHDAA